jgi:hypothetical protein
LLGPLDALQNVPVISSSQITPVTGACDGAGGVPWGNPERVIAKVSQATLADMIGTSRSRVSTFMSKFRKLGLINYNGGLEVHSSLLTMVLHETPAITADGHSAE